MRIEKCASSTLAKTASSVTSHTPVAGPSPGFSSRGAKNQKGGHIFEILHWMYAATRGPNVKWGAQAPRVPRWRRPCPVTRPRDTSQFSQRPQRRRSCRAAPRRTMTSHEPRLRKRLSRRWLRTHLLDVATRRGTRQSRRCLYTAYP